MLNGLLWNPCYRKKRGGSRQINARLTALSLLSASPQGWTTPFWVSKTPKRLRLRLRTYLVRLSSRGPLANALLNSTLAPRGSYRYVKPRVGSNPPMRRSLLPVWKAPIYLRVGKASRPARAVLRFFYLHILNPTPSVVTFAKSPASWRLSPYGSIIKSPFGPL